MSKKLYTAAEVSVMTERLDAEIAILREGHATLGEELATAIGDLKEAQDKMEAEMRKREAAEQGREAAEKRALDAIARAAASDARADAAVQRRPDAPASNGADVIGAINKVGDELKAALKDGKPSSAAQPIVVPAAPVSYDIGIQRTADGMLHSLTLTPKQAN